MKNATPKLPLFSFFMFLFEKTPIRPRTSFLSGQKMPPLPGLLAGAAVSPKPEEKAETAATDLPALYKSPAYLAKSDR